MEEEVISLVRESWIKKDEEDKDQEEEDLCVEFSWLREISGFAELDEVEDIISRYLWEKWLQVKREGSKGAKVKVKRKIFIS